MLAALDELGAGPDRFELALDPELPPVEADPVLLQRVLVNVMANAARHAPAGSRVRVSTSRLGRTAEIRVVDNGSGVSPERRDDMSPRSSDWATPTTPPASVSDSPSPRVSPRAWAVRSPPRTRREGA